LLVFEGVAEYFFEVGCVWTCVENRTDWRARIYCGVCLVEKRDNCKSIWFTNLPKVELNLQISLSFALKSMLCPRMHKDLCRLITNHLAFDVLGF